jgi:hypothetical protein
LGWICSTNGEDKFIKIYSKNLKGTEFLGVLRVDGRIILKWTLKNETDDWAHPAQHRDQ